MARFDSAQLAYAPSKGAVSIYLYDCGVGAQFLHLL